MPVASFTDWININIGPTVKLILSAKIQVTLAIGTPDQLNAFKTSRKITVLPCITAKNESLISKKANPTALADMLSTFIDNLALSLPKRSESDQQRQHHPTDPRLQLRRTSDLLDVLHNALKNPAPANLITSTMALPSKLSEKVISPPTTDNPKPIKENNRVVIHVESVRNVTIKENTQGCYVSFEAIDCDKRVGHYSNFATKIAQNNCNPFWNEKFNVKLPMDLYEQVSNNKIMRIIHLFVILNHSG